MSDSEKFHEDRANRGVRWAIFGGFLFAFLGILLAFYFGGYSGFLFFKRFYYFPLGLTARTYFGLVIGIILAVAIFWAFGTIGGAFVWWLIYGRKRIER